MPRPSAIAAALLCLAGPALAQTTNRTTAPDAVQPQASPPQVDAPPDATALPRPAPDDPALNRGRFFSTAPNGAMRGSRLVGVEVMGQDHVKIGRIEDLMVDGSGRVQAVVIGVGGFLGLGEKRVAVPFDLLLWNTGDVARAQTPSASNTADAPSTAGVTSPNPGQGASANVNPGGTTLDRTDAARRGPATVPVMPDDGQPERALVRLTRGDFERAPEFRFDAAARAR